MDKNKGTIVGLHEQNRSGSRFRKLTFVGVLALAVLVGFIAVRGFSVMPDALSQTASAVSSVFRSSEQIRVRTDSPNIISGQEFNLTWEHKGQQTDGSYSFSYACRDGLHFEKVSPDGEPVVLDCNTHHELSGDGKVELLPVSTANRFIDVPTSVHFIRSTDSRILVSGDTLLTVTNREVSDSRSSLANNGSSETSNGILSETTPEENTPSTVDVDNTVPSPTVTPPPVPAPPQTPLHRTDLAYVGSSCSYSDPAGVQDLAVKILSVGVKGRSAPYTFTQKNEIMPNELAAVKFEIANLGTKTLEAGWEFQVILPTKYPTSPRLYVQDDPKRHVLCPGEKIELEIGFDQFKEERVISVVITADPNNRIREATKTNNTAVAHLNVAI
jgi:hypothetical protein